mmetsp:Transcript_56718/g.133134  ORF Transcript_56718/g.133134 Transcript_56718/m.133134 type:complete len:205 (-) Transcript_56718:10-624(-)
MPRSPLPPRRRSSSRRSSPRQYVRPAPRRRSLSRGRMPSKRRSRSCRRSPPRRRTPEPRRFSPRRPSPRRERPALPRPSPRRHVSRSPLSEGRKARVSPSPEGVKPDPVIDSQPDGMDSEIHTAVIDGIPRSNGDPTWRAEVTVPREGGAGPLGRRGTTNIRGPNRVDRNLVHGDIDKLVQAYKDGGSQLIRQTQRDLNRSWVN